jgi:hypothetical protein
MNRFVNRRPQLPRFPKRDGPSAAIRSRLHGRCLNRKLLIRAGRILPGGVVLVYFPTENGYVADASTIAAEKPPCQRYRACVWFAQVTLLVKIFTNTP